MRGSGSIVVPLYCAFDLPPFYLRFTSDLLMRGTCEVHARYMRGTIGILFGKMYARIEDILQLAHLPLLRYRYASRKKTRRPLFSRRKAPCFFTN